MQLGKNDQLTPEYNNSSSQINQLHYYRNIVNNITI